MSQAANFKTRYFKRIRRSRHPVKLTALLDLKAALLEERYEDCVLAIRIAKEFGAQDFEVQNLLEDQRRTPV